MFCNVKHTHGNNYLEDFKHSVPESVLASFDDVDNVKESHVSTEVDKPTTLGALGAWQ